MRHSRFKGCSKKEDLPSQAQTGPAALCAVRGFEGGGTPPHQREWSGQGEALSWPREYAGEEDAGRALRRSCYPQWNTREWIAFVSHMRDVLREAGTAMSHHSAMLHVRVDGQLKTEATQALAWVGLTLSDAVRILRVPAVALSAARGALCPFLAFALVSDPQGGATRVVLHPLARPRHLVCSPAYSVRAARRDVHSERVGALKTLRIYGYASAFWPFQPCCAGKIKDGQLPHRQLKLPHRQLSRP